MGRRVGISLCGGCNPRVDRGRLMAEIREQLVAFGYDLAYNRPDSDFIIYLSGCSANCAQRYRKSAAGHTAVTPGAIDAAAVAETEPIGEIVKKVRDHFDRLAKGL
jgi:hypothetical protein